MGPINNIPALVQIMAWRRQGDKPLSEPMIVYWCIYASLGLNELIDLRRTFGLEMAWCQLGAWLPAYLLMVRKFCATSFATTY